MDAAGVIDEVGDGAETSFAIGDAVMAMVIPKGSHGAYRESIVLFADSVVPANSRQGGDAANEWANCTPIS